MTMLAMWLDDKSVALATDSKMGGETQAVQKLHWLNKRAMFGIGFSGTGAFDWLREAPCKKHPYPEHWRDCSKVNNTSELERIIQKDLSEREFPQTAHLAVWIAGINQVGDLEAFILNGKGFRVKSLASGEVIFNDTITKFIATIHPSSKPEQQFYALKKEMDEAMVDFPGAKALRELSKQLIKFCEDKNYLVHHLR